MNKHWAVKKIPGSQKIGSLTADGAYDKRKCQECWDVMSMDSQQLRYRIHVHRFLEA
ncbi:MAG: hypothetical protein ACI9ND_002642 [Yoonia sp.]|jgi:hypothetical protein